MTATPEAPRASVTDSGPTPDTAHAPPIDAPPVDATPTDEGPLATRLRATVMKLASYVDDLPEWFTSPPSIIDFWKYARQGAWTTAPADKGLLRALATIWACFAISLACPAYLLVWSAGRPVRFLFCYLATTLIGTGLAQVPILGLLVPPIYNIAPLF